MKNIPTAPSVQSSSSAAPSSTTNVHGPSPKLKPVASSGPFNASSTIHHVPPLLRPQDPREHHNARVQLWLEFLFAYSYPLGYPKYSTNGNADIFLRLPQPATDLDRIGPKRLTSPDTVGAHFIETCGFTPVELFTPGIGSGGLVPPPSVPFDTIPPLPCIDNDVGNFRRHGPRVPSSNLVHNLYPLVASVASQDTVAVSPRSLPPGPHFA